MKIIWDGVETDSEIEAAINLGASHTSEITFIATSNFENAVRQFRGYEDFSSDRGSGIAGAKSITDGSGQYILLSIPHLIPFGLDYLTRVVCHETGHALTSARGETDFTSRETDDYGDADLRALAMFVLDEYRAELLATELRGSILHDPEDAGHLIHVANCEILNALLTEGIEPDELALIVLKTLERVAKQLADYLANDQNLKMIQEFDESTLALWNSYLGDSWKALAETLALAPSSVKPVRNLDDLIFKTTNAIRKMLDGFGFRFDPEGAFWRTGSDALFTSRHDASTDFVNAHPE